MMRTLCCIGIYMGLFFSLCSPASASKEVAYDIPIDPLFCGELRIVRSQIESLSKAVLAVSQEGALALANNDHQRYSELQNTLTLLQAKYRGKKSLLSTLEVQRLKIAVNPVGGDVVNRMLLTIIHSQSISYYWRFAGLSRSSSPIPLRILSESESWSRDETHAATEVAPDFAAWRSGNGYGSYVPPLTLVLTNGKHDYGYIPQKCVSCYKESTLRSPTLEIDATTRDLCNVADNGQTLAALDVALSKSSLRDEPTNISYRWVFAPTKPRVPETLNSTVLDVFDAGVQDFLIDVFGENQTYKVSDSKTKALDPGVLKSTLVWKDDNPAKCINENKIICDLSKFVKDGDQLFGVGGKYNFSKAKTIQPSLDVGKLVVKSTELNFGLDSLNDDLSGLGASFTNAEVILALQKPKRFSAVLIPSTDLGAVEFKLAKGGSQVVVGFVVIGWDHGILDTTAEKFEAKWHTGNIEVGYLLLNGRPYFYHPWLVANKFRAAGDNVSPPAESPEFDPFKFLNFDLENGPVK